MTSTEQKAFAFQKALLKEWKDSYSLGGKQILVNIKELSLNKKMLKLMRKIKFNNEKKPNYNEILHTD